MAKTTVAPSTNDALANLPGDYGDQSEGRDIDAIKKSTRSFRFANTGHQRIAHRYQNENREKDASCG